MSVILTTATVTIFEVPARSFTITQNNNENDLLSALLSNTDGLSNFSITTTGDPNAFGLFNNDPFGLDSGVVLSTGLVEQLPGENTQDDFFVDGEDLSTDFGVFAQTDDSITLDISFDADDTAETLFFTYVFGSEEFLEFGGDVFNDSFTLELNGTNLALLNDGQLVTVNNLTPSPTPPFNNDFISNPAEPGTETKLDGFTVPLTFEGSLIQNATNTLSINVQDVSDGILDSAVFIKGDLGTEQVFEPVSVLSLLAVGIFGLTSPRCKRK